MSDGVIDLFGAGKVFVKRVVKIEMVECAEIQFGQIRMQEKNILKGKDSASRFCVDDEMLSLLDSVKTGVGFAVCGGQTKFSCSAANIEDAKARLWREKSSRPFRNAQGRPVTTRQDPCRFGIQ